MQLRATACTQWATATVNLRLNGVSFLLLALVWIQSNERTCIVPSLCHLQSTLDPRTHLCCCNYRGGKKGEREKREQHYSGYSARRLFINCYYLSSFQSEPACVLRMLKCVALGSYYWYVINVPLQHHMLIDRRMLVVHSLLISCRSRQSRGSKSLKNLEIRQFWKDNENKYMSTYDASTLKRMLKTG